MMDGIFDKTIKAVKNRPKELEDKDVPAPEQAASAPDLKPGPAMSFFKSPTAPAGEIVGRPKPPKHMQR